MDILNIISPLVIVALLGFIATKSGKISKDKLNTLSEFTFSLAIPAFLFHQMAKAQLSSLVSWQLFTSFYLPILFAYFIAFSANFFFHSKFKKQSNASAVFALGASYSNTIIVGLPVLLMLFGEQVLGILFLVIAFHSALLFAITAVLASLQSDKAFNWQNLAATTIKNPLIVAITTGLLINLAGIKLPEIIDQSLALIGKPAITLALFILGGSLSFYRIRHEVSAICAASVIKLIVLPLTVYVLAKYGFNLPEMATTVLVILTACPTGVNAYLVALQFNKHQETVAGTVVLTTLTSVITIPLWLIILT